jgi:hypothetical protein
MTSNVLDKEALHWCLTQIALMLRNSLSSLVTTKANFYNAAFATQHEAERQWFLTSSLHPQLTANEKYLPASRDDESSHNLKSPE